MQEGKAGDIQKASRGAMKGVLLRRDVLLQRRPCHSREGMSPYMGIKRLEATHRTHFWVKGGGLEPAWLHIPTAASTTSYWNHASLPNPLP